MAEITKLEEHIKCTRRSDSVKEEKMGLLTYNLASAESQIAQDNVEAGQKRQVLPLSLCLSLIFSRARARFLSLSLSRMRAHTRKHAYTHPTHTPSRTYTLTLALLSEDTRGRQLLGT